MKKEEILSGLKTSYDYLRNIKKSEIEYHQSEPIKNNIDKLDKILNEIGEIYSDVYKTFNKRELTVKGIETDQGERVYISKDISMDFDDKNGNSYTGYDLGYYWNEEYSFSGIVIRGLMNSIKENIKLTKQDEDEFNYCDKIKELTGAELYYALDIIRFYEASNIIEEDD